MNRLETLKQELESNEKQVISEGNRFADLLEKPKTTNRFADLIPPKAKTPYDDLNPVQVQQKADNVWQTHISSGLTIPETEAMYVNLEGIENELRSINAQRNNYTPADPLMLTDRNMPQLPPDTSYKQSLQEMKEIPAMIGAEIVKNPLQKAVPFSPKGTFDMALYIQSAKRLQADKYIDIDEDRTYTYNLPNEPKETISKRIKLTAQQQRESDLQVVREYQRLYGTPDDLPGQVGKTLSEMPKFMVEFWLTGGLKTAAKNTTSKLLGSLAEKEVGKIASKTSGYVLGSALQAGGMPNEISESILKRRLPQVSIDKDGSYKVNDVDESMVTSISLGFIDHYIEVLSENTGEDVFPLISKTPFVGKILTNAGERWRKMFPNRTMLDFAKAVSTKAGFNGVVGEIGEEFFGDQLRAIIKTDDFGAGPNADVWERMKNALAQDTEQLPVMALTFSVPGVARNLPGMFSSPKVLNEIADINEQIEQVSVKLKVDFANRDELPYLDEKTGEVIQPDKLQDMSGENIEDGIKSLTEAQTQASEQITKQKDNINQLVTEQQEPQIKTKPLSVEADIQAQELPSLFAPRNSDIAEHRRKLGLNQIASPTRKVNQETYDNAIKQGIPEKALRIANDVLAQKRQISDVETAGLDIAILRLEDELRPVLEKLSKATETQEIQELKGQMSHITEESDTILAAIEKGGTEVARALQIRQRTARLTKDSFELIRVRARAKAAKGENLTTQEEDKVLELTNRISEADKKIAKLQAQLNELTAQKVLKHRSNTRKSLTAKEQLNVEKTELIQDIRQLLKQGCY